MIRETDGGGGSIPPPLVCGCQTAEYPRTPGQRLVPCGGESSSGPDSVSWRSEYEAEPGGEEYPHIYGAVPVSAVTNVNAFSRDAAGNVIMPR